MPWIRLLKTALVLAAICVAAVPLAAQAATGGTSVSVQDCTQPEATFVAKCFKITTKPAAAVSVNIGVDNESIIPTFDRAHLIHTVFVKGLQPNTRYNDYLVITPKKGPARRISLPPFSTAVPGSQPATMASRGNQLLLNGWPTLYYQASMDYCIDQPTIAQVRNIKLQSIVSGICGMDPNNPAASVPQLNSWFQQVWMPINSVGQSSLPNFTQGLLWSTKAYKALPFPSSDACTGTGGVGGVSGWFAKVTNEVAGVAPMKPVLGTVWAASYLDPGTKNCLNPRLLDLFFWATLAKGAKGLDILTSQPIHATDTGNFTVDSNVQAAIAKHLSYASTFGMVVCGGQLVSFPSMAPTKLVYQTWEYGNSWYVVVVNGTKDPQVLALRPPSAAGTVAQGMFGTKSLKMKRGLLQLTVGPWARGVYKLSRK